MKKYILFCLFFGLCALTFSSCDEGRISEKEFVVTREGRILKLVGKVSGIGSWPSSYDVVIAGFEEGDKYSVVSKPLPVSSDGAELQLVLSGIPENVSTLKLCVINRLRRSVVDFQTLDKEAISSAATDTIMMDVGTLDVSMYRGIQAQVFDRRCIGCHGSSTGAAAGLYLTEGRSYGSLVNIPSAINGGYMRVKPGNAKESYLHLVLNEEGHDSHGHLDILSAGPEKLTLIDEWINNDARQ
ncbi:MAG: hypothetical protein LUE99_00810 [Bacteroides sp.]|nr:hypothetical protein [Bacteroides sp.]